MIITAHIENEQNSFGGIDQFIIIDSISESQSELSEHFFDNQKKLGFSHPKSYAKCYVYGKVIHKFEKKILIGLNLLLRTILTSQSNSNIVKNASIRYKL